MAAVSLSDADLIRRCQNGDLSAYGEIMERYGSLIRALTFSACGDPTRGDDIAQEAFVTAWTRMGDLRDAGKFRPWLCAIARQMARLAQRKRSRRPEGHAVQLDELPEIPANTLAPDQALERREDAHLVWRMLEGLPLSSREVLVLFYQEEHTTGQIAEELGLSEQAVRQRLARGRALLRGRLAKFIERSLSGARRSGGTLPAMVLAALPAMLPRASRAASLCPKIPKLTLMTKTHAIAAGLVLTSLIGTPFLLQQRKTIATTERGDRGTAALGKQAESLRASPGTTVGAVGSAVPTLSDLRRQLLDRRSRRNVAALWRHAERLSVEDMRQLILEALASGGSDWRDKEIAALLLERLGQVDSKAATALVASLDPRMKADTLAQLAAFAPHEAAGLFHDMREKERSLVPLDELLKSLAAADLNAAKRIFDDLPPSDRPKAHGLICEALSETDPGAALAFLQTLSGEDLKGGLSNLPALRRVAERAAAEVAGLLEQLPMTSDAASKYALVAEAWAARAPREALAWVESLDFEGVRVAALEPLYRAWARSDQEAAFAALDRIADPAVRGSIFDEMTWEAIERDPKEAESWVRGMQGKVRAYALGLLGAYHSSTDVELAKNLLQESIDAGASRLSWPSGEIGYAYARQDPSAAAQWAMTLPERAESRQHGTEGVARAWLAKDPVAASEWVATLPPGEARNGAIYYLVESIAASDPASAFRWASSIEGDEAKRRDRLFFATDAWIKTAPNAAKAAVEALPLSKSERQILLKRL